MPQSDTAFIGLRTAKYSAPDVAAAKAWYSKVLEGKPYFDEPFYVGFNVGGFELGITPEADAPKERPEAGIAYWGSRRRRGRVSQADFPRGDGLREGGRRGRGHQDRRGA